MYGCAKSGASGFIRHSFIAAGCACKILARPAGARLPAHPGCRHGLVVLFASEAKGPYNIAANAPVTIRQIVELIGAITGKRDLLQIGALPARANDAPLVLGDGRRASNDFGWKPKLTLEEGLLETVEWWRSHADDAGDRR